MLFTAAQCRAIRQGKITGTLVPHTERIRPGRVRVLRRRPDTGEDGVRPCVETVCDTLPGGERIAVRLTILLVRDLSVEELTLVQARSCGHRTTGELRDAWCSEHPRADIARLVGFALGDLLDTPTLLAWSGSCSDYAPAGAPGAMAFEPEPVSRDEQRRYADVRGRSICDCWPIGRPSWRRVRSLSAWPRSSARAGRGSPPQSSLLTAAVGTVVTHRVGRGRFGSHTSKRLTPPGNPGGVARWKGHRPETRVDFAA